MLEEKLSYFGDDFGSKIRKHYTITKQRERWTDEEHQKFLDALKLYGRAWRRIEEHIGTKTTVQIRSHAQKFFGKVEREQLGGTASDTPLDISIPPPRPKRKPNHPYPRKAGVACFRSPLDMETNDPPSSAPLRESVNPPLEEGSSSPRTNPAVLSTSLHKVQSECSDTTAVVKPQPNKQSPSLKLFGQDVVVNPANYSIDSGRNSESSPADSEDCERLTAPELDSLIPQRSSSAASFVSPNQLTIVGPWHWFPAPISHSLDNSGAGRIPEVYPMAILGLPSFSIDAKNSDPSAAPSTPTSPWWAFQGIPSINLFNPSFGLFYSPAVLPLLSASDKFLPAISQLEQAGSDLGRKPLARGLQAENRVEDMLEETQTDALTCLKKLELEESPRSPELRRMDSNQSSGSTGLGNSSCNGSCNEGQCGHGSCQTKPENFASERDQKRSRRESTNSTCTFAYEDVNSCLRTKEGTALLGGPVRHDEVSELVVSDGSSSENGGPSSTSSACGNLGRTTCSKDNGVSKTVKDLEDWRWAAEGDTQSIASNPQDFSDEMRMTFHSAQDMFGSSSTSDEFQNAFVLPHGSIRRLYREEGCARSSTTSSCTPPTSSLSTVTSDDLQVRDGVKPLPASFCQVSAFRRLYSSNGKKPEHGSSDHSQKFGGKKGLTVAESEYPSEFEQASTNASPVTSKGEDLVFKSVGFIPYQRPCGGSNLTSDR